MDIKSSMQQNEFPIASVYPVKEIREARTAVIVLNWNNADDTRCCLESLDNSLVPVIKIVVDNASTDRAIETVCREIPDTILINNQENAGFGRGNNVGLKWALNNTSASFLMLLNNDASIEPATIQLLEAHLDQNPQIACVTAQIVFADDPALVWYGGGEIDWKRGSGSVLNWQRPRETGNVPKPVSFVSGCAMLLRREVLEEVGGFDPRYFMYEEDVEFSIRLAKSGFRTDYLPQSIVLHRVQGSWRKGNDPFVTRKSPDNSQLAFFMYHRIKNRLLTMHKHANLAKKLRFAIYFHITLCYHLLLFLRYGRIDAIQACLRGYQHFLRERRQGYADEINGRIYRQ